MQQSKNNPVDIFSLIEYEDKYFDVTLELLTRSYKHSAPFVKQLGLTEEFMKKEFKYHLETNYYSHGILALHKETQQIVACQFWDAFERFDWKEVDIQAIPSKADVRSYMRHASIQPYYQEIYKNPGVYIYAGDMAVNTKYMGYGISALLNYSLGHQIYDYGYRKILNNAINPFSKAMLDNKPFVSVITEINCETISLKTGEKPFQGSGYTYKSYCSDVPSGLNFYFKRFGKKLDIPLSYDIQIKPNL